jgi:hypothetical protein
MQSDVVTAFDESLVCVDLPGSLSPKVRAESLGGGTLACTARIG